MAVELTEDEFRKIYNALGYANNPYGEDELPILIAAEAEGWEAILQARHRADPTFEPPPFGDFQPL